MLTLALTGGIASGKSTAVRLFQEFVPDIVIFDCDASVKSLLDEPAIISELTSHFGNSIIDPETEKIIREKLRLEVFGNPEKRKLLESILHPRVREECLALKEKSSKQGARCFLADVPLLFENGFDFGYDQAITLANSRATQVARLKARNGWNDELIESVLAAQLPVEEKISRADIVFWKDDPGYFPGPDVWSAGGNPRTSGITQPPVAASCGRRMRSHAFLLSELPVDLGHVELADLPHELIERGGREHSWL